MKKERFDLKGWREGLPKKTSKMKAAGKIGIDPHSYNKYEAEGLCPKVVMLAAQRVEDLEIQMVLNGYKP